MRGQISTFFILGVLLLIVFLLFFSSIQKAGSGSFSFIDEKPLVTLVTACIKETTHEAASVIAGRGGYYPLPEPLIILANESHSFPVPYYHYADGRTGRSDYPPGGVAMPSNETIMRALESYLAASLAECVLSGAEKLSARSGDAITFSFEALASRFRVSGSDLFLTVALPTTVLHRETQQIRFIPSYQTIVSTSLFEARDTAGDIARVIVNAPNGSWCVTCVQRLVPSSMRLTFTESSQPPDEIIVFELRSNETKTREEVFRFAVRLSAPAPDFARDERRYIDDKERLAALSGAVGKPFEYQVRATPPLWSASGDTMPDTVPNVTPVIFSDDTPLFDITSRGRIGFTPSADMRGEHLFEITIRQPSGAWDSALGKITIE